MGKHMVSVYFDTDDYKLIKAEADKECRSVSKQVIHMCYDWMTERYFDSEL